MNYFEFPYEQLPCLLIDADITEDIDEIEYVADVIKRRMRKKDLLPSIVENFFGNQSDQEIAEKGLIGCGFFRGRLNWLNKFHNRPSFKTYLKITKGCFNAIEQYSVAENLKRWTDFLYETFEKPMLCKIGDTTKIKEIRGFKTTSFHKSYADYREWKAPGRLSREYELGNLQKKDLWN